MIQAGWMAALSSAWRKRVANPKCDSFGAGDLTSSQFATQDGEHTAGKAVRSI